MFCGKCGNRVPDGAKFCNVCGNKIINEQEEKAPLNVNELPVYREDDERTVFEPSVHNIEDNDRTVLMPQAEKFEEEDKTVFGAPNYPVFEEINKPDIGVAAEYPVRDDVKNDVRNDVKNDVRKEKPKKDTVKKKKSKKNSIIIICALIVVVSIVMCTLALTGVLPTKDESSDEVSTEESIISESVSEEVSEVSVEESEPEGFVYGNSGIYNGIWSRTAENTEYTLDLKLDGSAIFTVKNGASVFTIENTVVFTSSIASINDTLNIGSNQKIFVFTDYRRNNIVVKYNEKYIILSHKNSQSVMADERLGGYWRKGAITFSIDNEFIKFEGETNRYLAINEERYLMYSSLPESPYVFDIGSYVDCVINDKGNLDLIYRDIAYNDMKHVE